MPLPARICYEAALRNGEGGSYGGYVILARQGQFQA